jgi:signal transduction histidine kinase
VAAPLSPALTEAAQLFGGRMDASMSWWAELLAESAPRVEPRFRSWLKSKDYDARQQVALLAVSPGAAGLMFASARRRNRPTPVMEYLEHLEYHGRRLAKQNISPVEVMSALEEYNNILHPILRAMDPAMYTPRRLADFLWMQEQLQFSVLLTLNNAYYQVREAETAAYSELFQVELESTSMQDLLERGMETLTSFSRCQEATLFFDGLGTVDWTPLEGSRFTPTQDRPENWKKLKRARCFDPAESPAPANTSLLLCKEWRRRFQSCWSVPLIENNQLRGVLQFGFQRKYEWFPREQKLLEIAGERFLKAAEKARLVEELQQREEQIRKLAERMMHVEEMERRRISRELHDEAGQSMLCIRLQLETLESALRDESHQLEPRVGEVRDLTEKTIVEMRRLISALSPAVLEQLGLAAAVRQMVSRFQRLHGVEVNLSMAKLKKLPPRVEQIVYRLLQECFNNVAKHSGAKTVNVFLSSADNLFRLIVEDDGVGFSVEAALQRKDSFGLTGLRERVVLLGGNCSIESTPVAEAVRVARSNNKAAAPPEQSWVTRIRIELPVKPSPDR